MIKTLYPIFRRWSETGSVYILSDTHFADADCKLMDPDWITPEEQVDIINSLVKKGDTFVCLGDVGNPDYARQIKARKKILVLGNHDRKKDYEDIFEEIYDGPLFIADRILLSHEPVAGFPWCLNIHGHDHMGVEEYNPDEHYLNLAANVCGYTPVSLGKIIKDGILSDIPSIHRVTINRATERKKKRDDTGIEHSLLRSSLSSMYDDAYAVYKPIVDDFCATVASEENVEYLLDWLISFAGEEKCGTLFRRICDRYRELYPDTIQFYEETDGDWYEETNDLP